MNKLLRASLAFITSTILPLTYNYYFSLLDLVHVEQKLYLVFEFLDVDLKRYMDLGNKQGRPITMPIVKVLHSFVLYFYHLFCIPRRRDRRVVVSSVEFNKTRPRDLTLRAPRRLTLLMNAFIKPFTEVLVPTQQGTSILSLPSYSSPRSQASEPTYRQKPQPQTGGLRTCKGIRYSNENIHT
jgi:hypothetical protein